MSSGKTGKSKVQGLAVEVNAELEDAQHKLARATNRIANLSHKLDKLKNANRSQARDKKVVETEAAIAQWIKKQKLAQLQVDLEMEGAE